MARVFIGIGSNIQPARHIRSGVQALAEEFGRLRLSSVYESRAVGFDGPDFYNLVAEVESDQPVESLHSLCREIETRFGRQPEAQKFSSRTLDLDLLLVGQTVVADDNLNCPQLPRPEIDYNAFVLWPLAELAPHYQHPLHQVSLASLWQRYLQQHGEGLTKSVWPIHFDWGQRSVPEASLNTSSTARSRHF